jgi:hypothetical protein
VPHPLNPVTPEPVHPVAEQPSLRLTPRDPGYGAERALWTLVGLALLWSAWRLDNFTSAPWTVPFMVLGNLWGMVTVLVSWLPNGVVSGESRLADAFQWATAVITVTLLIVAGVAETQGISGYGTDAVAFNQYAAELARQGINPYVHSLARAYTLFGVHPRDYTYTLTGAHVTALSYPALSFLIYVPLLALGWTHNLAPLVNVGAWGLTAAMTFWLSSRSLRPVVLLFSGFGVFAVFAGGGVTDVLFMPLLTVAAYRWDRFGASRWSYAGPLMFGLAMAIKQTPWPMLPFLLIALALDQSRRSGPADGLRRAGRYLAAVAVAFALPNLPYFLASPHAWIQGVLTPLHNLVPTGLGTIALTIYVHMGGGSLSAFTVAEGLIFVLTLVAFLGTYPLLRRAAWLLPGIAFLFASRSNVNYFAALIPAGYIAATSIAAAPGRGDRPVRAAEARVPRAVGRWFRSPAWALACGALALASVAAAVYSLSATTPLVMRLTGVQTAGRSNHIRRLTLRVANRSGAPVWPVFAVLQPGPNTTFWKIVGGPARLAIGQTSQYTLLAPGSEAEPSDRGTFNVLGFVASPASLAVSNEYDDALYRRGSRRRQSGSHSLDIRFSAG